MNNSQEKTEISLVLPFYSLHLLCGLFTWLLLCGLILKERIQHLFCLYADSFERHRPPGKHKAHRRTMIYVLHLSIGYGNIEEECFRFTSSFVVVYFFQTTWTILDR